MKRQTQIHLDETDRRLLAREAERVGASWAAVIRRLIREHLSTAKETAR
jgi:hypothetical protein